MKWLIAILIFSLLILFHEFGHFLAAKLNGVRVLEFSMGFGPRLLSVEHGGTRYSLKALLFGGSCRMKGMLAGYEEEGGGDSADDEDSFLHVSVGRRMAIVLAGPLFNFLLAFICAVIVISVVGYDPAEILYVAEGSAAEKAGLKTGDVITSYNGEHVSIGRDVAAWEIFHDYSADRDIVMRVDRGGETHEVVFKPEEVTRYMMGITYTPSNEEPVVQEVQAGSPLDGAGVRAGDLLTSIDGTAIGSSEDISDYFDAHPLSGEPVHLTLLRGEEPYEVTIEPAKREQLTLGFMYNLGRVRTSPAGVMKYSAIELAYWIKTTVRSVGALFTGRFSVNDLSGPVGIVDMVGETYEETKDEGPLMTWMNMLNLIILLSANLGVMNLLPIPAIDGGRLLFLIIEAIRGKPLDEKLEMAAQTVAALLLMLLMFYVLYHDIATILQ